MKKFIFLLLLTSIPAFAQTVHYDDGTLGNVPVSTTNPLPVEFEAAQSVNATVSGTVTTNQQCDTAFIWAKDTLALAGKLDTLSKFAFYTLTNLNTMFKVRYQLTITADSTIQISTSGSFTSGLVFTLNTGESWTTSYLSPSKFPAIYIKMGSAITGVTTWRCDVHGY